MRVAIDARTLQEVPVGGIGRQLAHLVPLLARDLDLELLTDARRPPVSMDLPQHPLRGPASARGVSWLQLAVPRWLAGFRRGAAPAAVGLLGVTAMSLGRQTLTRWSDAAITAAALIAAVRWKVHPLWILIVGGLLDAVLGGPPAAPLTG